MGEEKVVKRKLACPENRNAFRKTVFSTFKNETTNTGNNYNLLGSVFLVEHYC
jgi:hypothetical protein